mmetsp:Transcript_19869/g.64530  ORF Transcript_19869/g.64530 Transcript_19869/m.64530 type:complete len:242 (-) Transcript_19869:3309-4034(-)
MSRPSTGHDRVLVTTEHWPRPSTGPDRILATTEHWVLTTTEYWPSPSTDHDRDPGTQHWPPSRSGSSPILGLATRERLLFGATPRPLYLTMLIWASRSLPSTLSPAVTKRREMVPEAGAGMTVSIFMADKTTRGSPSRISSPALTLTSTTTPGIGAPTEPRSSEGAFSRFEVETTEVSVTGTNHRSPLSSMITSLSPFSSGSPLDTSLTMKDRPSAACSSTSSPTAIGLRKSSVASSPTSP